MQKIILLIIFYLASNCSFSQEKFSCSVFDIATKKPVIYATVALKNINRGTHADVNGNFEIPIKYKKTGSIIISSIGYRTKEIKLANFTENKTNIIYLSVANSSLNEVVIKTSKRKKRRLLSTQIVKKAIENILENYPLEPHSYIGYYKEYQQPIGDAYQKTIKSTEPIKYLNVHEAIIETFDNGFDSDKLKSKQNQSLLYNYRTNKDFVQDSTLTVPYDNKSKKYSESVFITPLGGNELMILNLTNAIRNYDKMSFSFANILQKDFLQNHTFKLRKITFSNTVPLYEISFISISKKTGYDYTASGTIYISKQDFAIYKFNYNLYYRFAKNPQYTVTIEYKAKKDKMYLNYITFNNFFEANNGNYFKLDKAVLNAKENGFIIDFNRKIDLNSLTPFRRNFKVYYKGEKLKILNVSPFDTNNKSVSVSIDQKSIETINVKKERENANYATYFTFEINDIKDTNGFKINERASLKMNQYREFFVQEIFENKKLSLQNSFIDKSLPLSKSMITPLKLDHNYWMNTPLKTKKKK